MATQFKLTAYPLLSVMLFSSSFVYAQPKKDVASSSATTSLVERLEWIQTRLDQRSSAANWWWYCWTIFNGSLTVGQGIVAGATTDEDLRKDMIVGSATALIGFAAMFFIPFSPRYAAKELRTESNSSNDAELQRSIALGERYLRQAAEDERSGRSWVTHLGNFLVVAASSAVLLGLKRWESAAINFGVGMVVGEAFIFTQPTAAIDDWNTYRQRFARSYP